MSKLEEALESIWEEILEIPEEQREHRVVQYMRLTESLRRTSDIAQEYYHKSSNYFLEHYKGVEKRMKIKNNCEYKTLCDMFEPDELGNCKIIDNKRNCYMYQDFYVQRPQYIREIRKIKEDSLKKNEN